MKDIKMLVAGCEADLRSIGIDPGCDITWVINGRAKTRWGMCRKKISGECEISISRRLLEDDVDDWAAKNTIMHELLHCVPGADGHSGLWLKLANEVNRKLPQYHIKQTEAPKEKGLAPVEPKYILECTHCKQQFHRHRMSSAVRNPQRFRCGKCAHPLVRVR